MLKTTIFTSPKREEGILGGSAKWRGNHPPTLSKALFEFLHPKMVADPMCGSGTTGDVAKQMGIACWQGDLHQGFDLLKNEIPVHADLVWVHPPYHDMVIYSGKVWGKEAMPNDLSRYPDYESFIKGLNQAHYNAYQALRPGGHLAILVGDLKRKGQLYPIQRDMTWYGEPVQTIIKLQHNVWSGNTNYSGNFIRIMHEYLVLSRKPKQVANAWLVMVRKTEIRQADQRKTTHIGWRAIVWTALQALGGEAALQEIYTVAQAQSRVQKSEKDGSDWKAIIRRVLQESCTPVRRGVWALG
jgi:hypothetical protein